jgi:SanA protein
VRRLFCSPRFRRWVLYPALAAGLLLFAVNLWVLLLGRRQIVEPQDAEPAEAALILGAAVFHDGTLSDVLADRLEAGLALYRAGKVRKLLLSGDHGRAGYDEVNAMRRRLEAAGVPPEDIFLDHAGFNTYDSMYRARDVFAAGKIIVVTQQFHLPRALYIAGGLGLSAQGVAADRRAYRGAAWYEVRECAARVKAFACVLFGLKPKFLGPVIPLSGDGRATRDD